MGSAPDIGRLKAPPYPWSCHKCSSTNPAGTATCERCAFPAVASGAEIAEATEARHTRPPREANAEGKVARLIGSSTWLFFPEILIAGFVLVAMPFWLISLLARGFYSAALWAAVGVVVGGGLGWFAWKHESKVLLYVAILLILLAGWSTRGG